MLALILAALIGGMAPEDTTDDSPTMATSGRVVLAATPSQYAMLDGARVHYKSIGRGQPVIVFVHGWGGDHTVWREQILYFQTKARLLLVDLPGHGLSDKPETAYTMRYLARGIKAVLDHAGVERAILVGHSNGTPVIRQFDRIYPMRVRGLVAMDGALKPVLPFETVERIGPVLRGEKYREMISFSFDGMLAGLDAAARDEIKGIALATPQHVLASSAEAVYDREIWKSDQITVPLLVVNAKSPFWTTEYEEGVRALARDIDYRVIDGANHFVMLSNTAQVNTAIEEWMVKEGWLRGQRGRKSK